MNLLLFKDIDCFDANKFWNPLLYIDNSVGDLKTDVWHKVVYDGVDTPMIYEMRKVKGIFLENLELNDFPVDVQVAFFSFFIFDTSIQLINF